MTDRLDAYADLVVRVGANLQPGQTLFVNAAPEHVDLARAIARAAYRAGAAFVDVRYVDPHVRRAMIERGPDEALTASPDWQVLRSKSLDGNALAMIAGEADPELLADLDQERVGRARQVAVMETHPEAAERARDQLDDRRVPDRGLGRAGVRRARCGPVVGRNSSERAPRRGQTR